MDATWRNGWSTAVRLALQHHPLCHQFRADRFETASGRAVCSGCAMAFPGVVAGLVGSVCLMVLAWWPAWPLLAAGLVLGAPQGATYLVRFDRPTRAAIKGLGGLGLGIVAGAWWLADLATTWKVVGAAGIALVFGLLQAIRLRAILKVCRRCPWNADWDRCPGFRVPSTWQDP